jgi:hypothetical protein
VHASNEDKDYDINDTFYKELEQVFDQFPRYHMKILLGNFIAKVGSKDIFKLISGNDNRVGVVTFATSKKSVKSTTFPYHNIHKHTWTSPDGVTHNQIENVLTDRRWYSNILDV